jgi:hypothetical protein
MFGVRVSRGLRLATLTAVCALAGAAAAQDMPPTPVSPTPVSPTPTNTPAAPPVLQAEATPPPATPPVLGPVAPAANPLSKAQLEQLVAPVALYPDPLLSQVLMASTYPLEIVEADRWDRVPANQALKGDALINELKEKNWDPSIIALVPFPKLLALMADKLEWTEALGNAFLAQQADVMDAVQGLRHDAMAAGNLKVTPECHCVIQTSGNVISIMPAQSDVVCIPVYNPRVAYGAWPWPDYPPDYFPPPPGFVFEPGFFIGFWPVVELAAFGPFWGWGSFDWGHHDIIIDRARYAAIDPHPAFAGGTWVHDPAHRGGVGYGDPAVTSRFGAARVAAVSAAGRAALTGGRLGAAAAAEHFGGAAAAGRFGAAAGFGHAAVGHAPIHAASAFHGPVARGPAPAHGGGHAIAHAQFRAGGGPHFGGGGGHGGGGHGAGGGGHHH